MNNIFFNIIKISEFLQGYTKNISFFGMFFFFEVFLKTLKRRVDSVGLPRLRMTKAGGLNTNLTCEVSGSIVL